MHALPPLNIAGLIEALLAPSVVAVVLGALGKAYIDQRLKQQEQDRNLRSTAEIERLKAELNRDAEVIRHHQQRELTDFGIFTRKRQEVYAEAFSRLYRGYAAIGKAREVRRSERSHSAFSNTQLTMLMTDAGVKPDTQHWILSSRREAPGPHEQFDNSVRAVVVSGYIDQLTQDINTARGYIHSNALYFSQESSDRLEEFWSTLAGFTFEDFEPYLPLEKAFNELKRQMQLDISAGAVTAARSVPAIES
jgi:hypothetical protein